MEDRVSRTPSAIFNPRSSILDSMHQFRIPITPSLQSYFSFNTFSSGPFSLNGSGQPMYSLKSGRTLTKS